MLSNPELQLDWFCHGSAEAFTWNQVRSSYRKLKRKWNGLTYPLSAESNDKCQSHHSVHKMCNRTEALLQMRQLKSSTCPQIMQIVSLVMRKKIMNNFPSLPVHICSQALKSTTTI